jgi:4-hydroxythreonine-4-phosphate dehydrogenase
LSTQPSPPATSTSAAQSAACPLPLALTCGEPAGIAAEITLKAWLHRATLPPFLVLADPEELLRTARRLALEVPVREVASPAEAVACFTEALPVWPVPLAVPVQPGQPDSANAPAVLASIQQAVAMALSGTVAGVVTNPVHKDTLYRAGFGFPGHTEYLAALCNSATPSVMMLAGPSLRVIPATVHMPLRQVATSLTTEHLVTVGRIALQGLQQDFGLAQPVLAVAGLNPHAGEDGSLGDEEQHILLPAVHALCAEGWRVLPPAAADTLFHAEARQQYDVVLCMYHDQALIPLKTLHFWDGVNITLGLPIVRTSPDHGTALAIAGHGVARADSLLAALRLAVQSAALRTLHAGR